MRATAPLPLPGWAGLTTVFGAPLASSTAPPADVWAVLGVPFDSTASSRPGACEGPRAIRAASVVFSSYLQSLGSTEMHDCRTGEVFTYGPPSIIDAGDATVFPSDVVRTHESVRAEVAELLAEGAKGLFLNGDHSCTYATFAGFKDAVERRDAGARIGFVTVDHHFDYGDVSVLHGPIYHGSNSRRICELPDMRPEDVVFVGMGDVTRHAQLQGLLERGHHVATMADVRRVGVRGAVAEPFARLADRCSTVYVSLDIDVVDCSVAPGTGHVTIGGMTSGQLFDLLGELRSLPLGGFDIAEIAPRYDPSGRTAQIGARFLFELLFRHVPDPT